MFCTVINMEMPKQVFVEMAKMQHSVVVIVAFWLLTERSF